MHTGPTSPPTDFNVMLRSNQPSSHANLPLSIPPKHQQFEFLQKYAQQSFLDSMHELVAWVFVLLCV